MYPINRPSGRPDPPGLGSGAAAGRWRLMVGLGRESSSADAGWKWVEEVGAGAVNAEGLGHFADAANQEFHFLLGIEEMERGANAFRVIHLAHHDLVVLP